MPSAADLLGISSPAPSSPSSGYDPLSSGGSDLRFGVSYSQLVEPFRQQNRGYSNGQGGTEGVLRTTGGLQTILGGVNGVFSAICQIGRCSNPFSQTFNQANSILGGVNSAVYGVQAVNRGRGDLGDVNPYRYNPGPNQNIDAGIALRTGLVDNQVGFNQDLSHWSLRFNDLKKPIDAYTSGGSAQRNIMAVQDICLAKQALQTILKNAGMNTADFEIPSARADGSGNVQLQILSAKTGQSSWISVQDVRSQGVERRVQDALYRGDATPPRTSFRGDTSQSMSLPTGAAPEEYVTGAVPTGSQPSADFAPQVVADSRNPFPIAARPTTGGAMAAFLNSLPEPGTTGASPEQTPARTEVPTDPTEIAQTISTPQDPGVIPTGSVATTVPQSTEPASAEDVAFAKIMALSAHLGEPQDTLTSSQEGGDLRSVARRNVRPGVRTLDPMGYSPVADQQVIARIAAEEVPRVSSFFSQMPTSSTGVQPLAFG